jgi:hypothetical protein
MQHPKVRELVIKILNNVGHWDWRAFGTGQMLRPVAGYNLWPTQNAVFERFVDLYICVYYIIIQLHAAHNFRSTKILINNSLLVCKSRYLCPLLHFILQAILMPHIKQMPYTTFCHNNPQ